MLRTQLAEKLAIWMVPTLWIVVDDMPTNASGKLDRNTIRSFVADMDSDTYDVVSRFLVEEEFLPPSTPTEVYLQKVWGSVLNIATDQISASTSFLRLGGDSITAMQVMSRCRVDGLLFSVRDILQSRTISELSSCAKSEKQTGTELLSEDASSSSGGSLFSEESEEKLYKSIKSQAQLRDNELERILPATDFQVSSLAQSFLKFRGDVNYHRIDIVGALDIDNLQRSCTLVVDRHPNMRSIFVAHARNVYQIILKSSPVKITQLVTRELPHDLTSSALVQEDLRSTFGLGKPLARIILVKQTVSNSHSLIIRLPHCLYDATTREILMADLAKAFRAEPMSQVVDPGTYFDFKASMRTSSQSYWRSYLEGSTCTQIIASQRPVYKHSKSRSVREDIRFTPLKKHSITTATLVKAAWAMVLAELSGHRDVTFGDLISGRNVPIADMEKLDIVTANVVPLRAVIQQDWTALDLLRSLQQRQLDSMPFQSLGTAQIIQECSSWPSWTQFGSVLNHVPLPDLESEAKANGTSWEFKGIFGRSNASPTLSISTHPYPQAADKLRVSVSFSDQVIAPSFATEILQRLCETIIRLSSAPNSALSATSDGPIAATSIPLPYQYGPIKKPAHVTVTSQIRWLPIVRMVWEEVLGSDAAGHASDVRNSDAVFWEYWGSIAAAAHFVAVYSSLGLDVSVEDIVEAPTINSQSMLCARSAGKHSKPS